MEKEYWLGKWHKGDIGFHEEIINPYLITYIDALNLQPGDAIFVPLCGKTKDMLWLADRGFHVIGVELSPIACQDFFTELNITPHITEQTHFTKYQHDNIALLCGDLFDLKRSDLPTIHAVYDCKALIALPKEIRKKYLDQIVACLGTQINILLLTRETSSTVTPPPFPIDRNEIQALYETYFKVEELKRVVLTDIPEHLVKKGFTDVTEGVYLMRPA